MTNDNKALIARARERERQAREVANEYDRKAERTRAEAADWRALADALEQAHERISQLEDEICDWVAAAGVMGE